MKMVMLGLLQTIPPLVLVPLIACIWTGEQESVMIGVDVARSVLVLLIPLLYAVGN